MNIIINNCLNIFPFYKKLIRRTY